MNSVDKLREWAQTVAASSPDENIVSPEYVAKVCAHKAMTFADDIEREISERYTLNPVDADGVPICVGDTLECHANGYDGVFDVFAIGTDCVVGNHPEYELVSKPFNAIHIARFCHHYHASTVEDVLRDCVLNCMTVYWYKDGKPFLGVDGRMLDDWIEGNVDKLREAVRDE